jgi:hypothetical protein
MVTIAMVALALSEDSMKQRARRNSIIKSLTMLPDAVRQVRAEFKLPPASYN